MALVNRQVLVLYDVPGPDLWHERLVLQHIDHDDYVVASPDQDVFYEELSLLNVDLKGIRVKPNANTLPAGIAAAQVYPLPAFTATDVATIRGESLRVLAEERVARGLAVVPAAAAPLAAGGGMMAGSL